MKNIIINNSIVLLSVLLSGCMKTITDEPYRTGSSQHVTFSAYVAPVGPVTRGTPVYSVDGLTSMGVFGAATGSANWSDTDGSLNKMFNKRLKNQSGVWTYDAGEHVYWDADDVVNLYTFFAYAPYAEYDNGITIEGSADDRGKPVLTYTVPNDVTKQPDLMVAVPRYDIKPAGNVFLQMKHALTCVEFQVSGQGLGEDITGISIAGVAVSGKLYVDGSEIEWENDSPTSADFSTMLDYDEDMDYYSVADNGYLMMIPQELGKDAKVRVTFSDGEMKEISLDSHIWEAGKRVVYTMALGEYGEIEIEVSQDNNGETDKESYRLDGGTSQLQINSSGAPWKVESIIEWTGNIMGERREGVNLTNSGTSLLLTPEGLNGLRNARGRSKDGDVVNITSRKDKTTWGRLEITFAIPGTDKRTVYSMMYALPKIKILGISYSNHDAGFDPAVTLTDYNANAMMNAVNNFGRDALRSTVYSEGFEFVQHWSWPIDIHAMNALLDEKPDVIVTGYDFEVFPLVAVRLREYMEQGGVLVHMSEQEYGTNRLMTEIFGRVDPGADRGLSHEVDEFSYSGGVLYLIPADNPKDPVTDGPFGSVRGKYWGEDLSETTRVRLNKASESDIISFSGTYDHNRQWSPPDPKGSSFFRHKTLPLVFIGDGGFIASSHKEHNILRPFRVNRDSEDIENYMRPVPHEDYGYEPQYRDYVWNSTIFANIMTWAISETNYLGKFNEYYQ